MIRRIEQSLVRRAVRRRLRRQVDDCWGRVTNKSTKRAAQRRAERLAQATPPTPRPTMEEYVEMARLAPGYRALLGVRQTVIRNPGPLLRQANIMREFLDQSPVTAWLRYWWTIVAGGIIGAIGGALGSGATFQMTYSYLGDFQVLFNGIVLAIAGIAGGSALGFLLYLAGSMKLAMTTLRLYEHADPDDPTKRTGRIDKLTYRLAWAMMSGSYFGGPSLESGLVSGIVKIRLPHMLRIDDLDLTPYRVVSREWELNTPTMSLWPRVMPDHTLTARREHIEYAGFYPYDYEPSAANWNGNADREREDMGEEARRYGELKRKRRRGLADLLMQNPGYTGGIVMLAISFLMMAGWD